MNIETIQNQEEANRARAASEAANAKPIIADRSEDAPARPKRTTRQFNLGNGTRLVDTRPSGGILDVIAEGPKVNFDDIPEMSEREAVEAVLDFGNVADMNRDALIRQIMAAGEAAKTPAAVAIR